MKRWDVTGLASEVKGREKERPRARDPVDIRKDECEKWVWRRSRAKRTGLYEGA